MASRTSGYFIETRPYRRSHALHRLRRDLPSAPKPKISYTAVGLLVLLTLAIIGWNLFGADLRRYIKMETM